MADNRVAPLYRARLTIERVEFVFPDGTMTVVDERNILTTDTLEVTTSDPHTSLAQLLALGAVKLEKGALVVSFVPAEEPSRLVPPSNVDEYRDEFGETDADWAARQIEKRQAIRKNEADEKAEADAVLAALKAESEHKRPSTENLLMDRTKRRMAKRPVPYQSVPVLRDPDDDFDDDDEPQVGRPNDIQD